MWTDLPHPAVIAHRGDTTHTPENTLPAFIMAAEKGADAIEFDVRLTADGQVIILHDQLVDRTTNGTGNASQLSLAAIRDLDSGAWFSPEFQGERVPTLEEVFVRIGKRVLMNIELKNYSTPWDSLVPKVAELVKKHGMEDYTLFSSFLSFNLNKAHKLLPKVPIGLLTMRGWLGSWGRTFSWRGGYHALHPFFTDVDTTLVNRVHAKGKLINVWTVNSEKDIKRMVGLGVDAILTDDPTLALRLLGRGI